MFESGSRYLFTVKLSFSVMHIAVTATSSVRNIGVKSGTLDFKTMPAVCAAMTG